MFAVLVDFEIKPGLETRFNNAMLEQAENSLDKEPGCHYFDICRDPDEPGRFFLYELYTSSNAFNIHLKSKHFLDFDKWVSDWVAEKSVRILQRVEPNK